MNTRVSRTLILLVLAVFAMSLISAAPSSAATHGVAQKVTRLTVENRSESIVYIWLTGQDTGTFSYVTVNPKSTQIFTPGNEGFDYELRACTSIIRSTVDLTKNQRIIVNECGQKGGPGTSFTGTTDTGAIVKIADITLTNTGDETMLLIFTGPLDNEDGAISNQYVFRLTANQTRTFTIPKGEYLWEMLWCDYDSYRSGTVFVTFNKVQEFECP
ncbi:MAG: hypothetical protein DWQ07_03260 [Chloroflexi bacterium]|nr:MAG: hypothetical protein DWQ07_03260 [Chloroflexota bacterium]MBL1193481.1 hypothetical protein [Chloroflexota bacterium]NOH10772.1 hypothetical protein [Chloroflexota bacterium]